MEQLVIPRPVNEKALRRWINEHAGTPADCFAWPMERALAYVETHHPLGAEAFRPANYTVWTAYTHASARARQTVDAVFHAVRNVAGPDLSLQEAADGSLDCFFTWHDGARYQVRLTAAGILTRLFRLELTGAWEWDDVEAREVPAEAWRTVRAFSRDRAGKVLAPALPGVPAASSWSEAAAR